MAKQKWRNMILCTRLRLGLGSFKVESKVLIIVCDTFFWHFAYSNNAIRYIQVCRKSEIPMKS